MCVDCEIDLLHFVEILVNHRFRAFFYRVASPLMNRLSHDILSRCVTICCTFRLIWYHRTKEWLPIHACSLEMSTFVISGFHSNLSCWLFFVCLPSRFLRIRWKGKVYGHYSIMDGNMLTIYYFTKLFYICCTSYLLSTSIWKGGIGGKFTEGIDSVYYSYIYWITSHIIYQLFRSTIAYRVVQIKTLLLKSI